MHPTETFVERAFVPSLKGMLILNQEQKKHEKNMKNIKKNIKKNRKKNIKNRKKHLKNRE